MQEVNRLVVYKMKGQENRNRQNNLWIGRIPEEAQGEDLTVTIKNMHNLLMDRPGSETLMLERLQRVRWPRT